MIGAEVLSGFPELSSGPTFASLDLESGESEPDGEASGPKVALAQPTIDLGEVSPGATIPIEISVANAGAIPLSIAWARYGEGCRLVELPRVPIYEGHPTSVRLELTAPTHQLGKFKRTVTLFTNAEPEEHSVQIVGRVRP